MNAYTHEEIFCFGEDEEWVISIISKRI